MTSIYERLQALQINLPEVPPPVVDGYVLVCALCADRQSYLFVGATGEEGRQAILRQSGARNHNGGGQAGSA